MFQIVRQSQNTHYIFQQLVS